MSKDSAAVSPKQEHHNPEVLIRYSPENVLPALSGAAALALKKLNEVKIVTVKDLVPASEVLAMAEHRMEEIEEFKSMLRERVQEAASQFRTIQGFEDFEVTLTIRKWTLNQLLADGIRAVRNMRAKFNADEEEKTRRANLQRQAEQDRINKEAADKAAASAKKAGADNATVKEIKQNVLATPAPVIESKAEQVSQSLGVSVSYKYTAKLTNLKSFLGFALNNEIILSTLEKAVPDIEKAFRKMAEDQKERFKYPGIEYVKTPVDVNRGR
jgi:anti-sigma28 factor (negative regulator of flagellin synthesis)